MMKAMLSPWPVRVNKPQDEKELATDHLSRNRGKPYCEPDWPISTAHRPGTESSLRPVGRLGKEENAGAVGIEYLVTLSVR